MSLRIVQTAHYVPPKVVSNTDLTKLMATSDEWIRTRTYIEERHVSTGEQSSDLGLQVARQLLHQAQWSAASLDFIIVATMSPDALSPSTAAIIQGQLQAYQALAFDLNAACSGFIYALVQANQLLQGPYQRGMVIGAETLSKLVNWQDRTTAVLFGDGAGGILLEDQASASQIVAQDLRSFGTQGKALTAGYQQVVSAFYQESSDPAQKYFSMDGRAVYRFATHEVPQSIERTLQQTSWSAANVNWWLLHQANGRIIQAIATHLAQSKTKFLMNVQHYGNTSAASIPILLDENIRSQKIQRGQKLMLSGFGGGLTVGSVALIY